MEYILLFPRLYNPNFGLSVGQKNKTKQKSGRFGSSQDARLSACRLMETQDKVRHLSDDQPALSIKWQKNKRTCAIIGQRLQYRSVHLFSPLPFDSQLSKANLLKQVLSGKEAVLTEILMFVLLPFPLVNIKILPVSQCIFFPYPKRNMIQVHKSVRMKNANKVSSFSFIFLWIQRTVHLNTEITGAIQQKRDHELRSNISAC